MCVTRMCVTKVHDPNIVLFAWRYNSTCRFRPDSSPYPRGLHPITRAQYSKTCNPDQDNPDNEILLFSVLDQGDPADFIRVFQNTGRVDHRDPDLRRVETDFQIS